MFDELTSRVNLELEMRNRDLVGGRYVDRNRKIFEEGKNR
jgi:hypothetical protein